MKKRIAKAPSTIPDSKVTHTQEHDCAYCVKDRHGRATGKFVKVIQEKTCRKCDGKGTTSKNKKCAHCIKGVFIWRSPLIPCRACAGTGHNKGPQINTAFRHAFDKAKKALHT